MQETNRYKTINSSDEEIDLRELFHVLFQGKWIIVSLTAFISIVGVSSSSDESPPLPAITVNIVYISNIMFNII